MENADERLKNEINREEPASRIGTASRRSRENDGREADDRELSDSDRIEMFRQTLFNDVLPDLPNIPGYHVCWLSTNHQSDSIARRMRLGYMPIRPSEVPGMDYASGKSGEHGDVISINEMIAFKLPMNLYEAFMQEAHHAAPAREAEMIVRQVDTFKEDAARDGGEIMEGDGMDELRRAVPSKGVFRD